MNVSFLTFLLAVYLATFYVSYANCQVTQIQSGSVALPSSCASSVTPQSRAILTPAKPRAVTFRSHLSGELNADPIVNPGEQIQVWPDPTEPTTSKDAILVRLPTETPYENDDDRLYYLRGFAVGQLSAANSQFH